jgi:hypothetical protein
VSPHESLVAAICEADEADNTVSMIADALWASEVSGHFRPSIQQRYDAALRAAIAAWDRVTALSSVIEDDQ